MVNKTAVLDALHIEKVQEYSGQGMLAYMKAFLLDPTKIGVITISIIIAIGFIIKQALDNSENSLQQIVWFFTIHFVLFMATLVVLIAFDAGEIAILGHLAK